MSDALVLFLTVFFVGGIFTTSVFCFLIYFARGRDKLFLGYGIVTLGSAFVIFSRRVLPVITPAGGHPWSDILPPILTVGIIAGALYYIIVFFRITRKQRAFGLFLGAFIVMNAILVAVLIRFLAGDGKARFVLYYFFVGTYAFSAFIYIIRALLTGHPASYSNKRFLVYLGGVFVFFTIISILNTFQPFFTFSLVIPAIYALLIFFFFVQGSKLNQDYRELFDLKAELEEKVRVRTNQLEDLHRKKQRFFITITHETKTPLTLVAACLDRYMASAPSNPDLDLMKRTLASMRIKMANALEFEKLLTDAEHFEHDQMTDLVWLFKEKIDLFQSLAIKKSLTLEASLPDALSIAADPAALDQIINNLLDNAVKYTNPGGRIEAFLRKKGKTVILGVRDTGIGVSPALRERIFEPFSQGSHKGGDVQGIGMGLAIVKQIVDGLGGEIAIKSLPRETVHAKESGQWVTEIEVAFPGSLVAEKKASVSKFDYVASEPADTIAPASAPSPGPRHDPGLPTVLLVEDNADFLGFLVSSLSLRYNAYGAADGREALDRIDSMPRPDVIVSDIMMAGMDGYAFFETLKALPRYRDVPFIFLTAVSSPLEKLKSLSGGAIDFITKPLGSVAELEAKIASLLELLKRQSLRTRGEVFDKLSRAIADERSDQPRQERLLKENMAAFGLTERERRIVECLREGLQNKEISARLGTSTRTVDNHLYNIFRKTGSQNRVDLLNRLLAPR